MSVPGHRVELAEALAGIARERILPYHRAALDVTEKADGTPVSEADRAAEDAMRAHLGEHAPDDGVIGEERGSANPDAAWCWLLDPIDGTKQFLTGKPSYGTLIALLHEGVPVLGVIEMPVLGERWLGVSGRGTRHTDATGTRFARTRACGALGAARLCTTVPTGEDEASADAFLGLAHGVAMAVSGGDCHNYGLLASGCCDLVLDATMSAYDYAALVPVVEGAGGVITDSAGDPLGGEGERTVLAAGDPRLHAAALQAMAGAG